MGGGRQSNAPNPPLWGRPPLSSTIISYGGWASPFTTTRQHLHRGEGTAIPLPTSRGRRTISNLKAPHPLYPSPPRGGAPASPYTWGGGTDGHCYTPPYHQGAPNYHHLQGIAPPSPLPITTGCPITDIKAPHLFPIPPPGGAAAPPQTHAVRSRYTPPHHQGAPNSQHLRGAVPPFPTPPPGGAAAPPQTHAVMYCYTPPHHRGALRRHPRLTR